MTSTGTLAPSYLQGPLPAMGRLKAMSQSQRWALTGGVVTSREEVSSGVRGHWTRPQHYFGRRTAAYMVPAENLREMMGVIGDRVQGKEVLTIACSGDPIIGFLASGAEYVTAIDISSVACMWAEFRTRLWQHSSPEEFAHFFEFLNENPFARRESERREGRVQWQETYDKTVSHVSAETRQLLDGYLAADILRMPVRSLRIYRHYEPFSSDTGPIDLSARSMILNLDFETALAELACEFGAIFMSNVLDYIYEETEKAAGEKEAIGQRANFLRVLSDKISSEGIIVLYLFGSSGRSIDNYRKASEMAGLEMEISTISSEYCKEDHIIVHSKK